MNREMSEIIRNQVPLTLPPTATVQEACRHMHVRKVGAVLITNPKGVTFLDLKQLCSLTDGNLSRHLRVLDEARIVQIVKEHDHNRPQTICRITPSGRKRYLEYLSTLEQVVRDAADASETPNESLANLARGLTPSGA